MGLRISHQWGRRAEDASSSRTLWLEIDEKARVADGNSNGVGCRYRVALRGDEIERSSRPPSTLVIFSGIADSRFNRQESPFFRKHPNRQESPFSENQVLSV
jgi:hypothetical protein